MGQWQLQRKTGNFVNANDIAWMIDLTQLLTTSKVHQQAGVN